MTGQDLIASSLRLIGVLASGEQPSGAEAQDALLILNQMIDSWTSERMNIFTLTILEFPLVPGQQTYTLGPGGNFNAARPARIERMSIVSLLNPAQPLELPVEMLTDEGWQAVPVKAITSTLPLQCYDDGAYPLRNLSFRYIPQIPVNTRIYAWTALLQFPDLFTDVTFPPAYAKALRYNLAMDLAPEFGVTAPQAVMAQAVISKSYVKSINAPLIETHCDSAVCGDMSARIYNWLTDNAGRRG